HNTLKPNERYQSDLARLTGDTLAQVGVPMKRFAVLKPTKAQPPEPKAAVFGAPVQILSGVNAYALGDLDDDRTLEIVALRSSSNTQSLESWSAKRGGSWTLIDSVPRARVGSELCLGDFSRDGWLDGAVLESGTIALYRRGQAGWVEGASLKADFSGAHGCQFADLDHDGDLDLFVAADSGLHYFRYVVDEGFREAKLSTDTLLSNGPIHGLAFADFDNDVDLDLRAFGPKYSVTLDNQRLGRFDVKTLGGANTGLFVDWTNNGFFEWLTLNTSGIAELSVGPEPATELRSLGQMRSIAIGDFNNDGWVDLAGLGESGSEVRILYNGPGRSQSIARWNPPTGYTFDSIRGVDSDGDGALEWLLSNKDVLYSVEAEPPREHLWLGVELRGLANGSGKTSRRVNSRVRAIGSKGG
ncbi:MAG: VCBS repeat-containing protein, partial [Myxococcota bacterium]